MDVALETAAERGRKFGLDEVIVVGWIHPRNHASERLSQRTGFRCQGITGDGLEIWAMAVEC